MTYSLDTLNSRNPQAGDVPGGVKRFAHEMALILGLIGLVFWLAALLSYSQQDAAWSTSGTLNAAATARNWGGRAGAWLADASYFLFGFSVWWMLAAGVRVWLVSLARWMRGQSPANTVPCLSGRLLFWVCLLLLLVASSGLEWSRLYRFESRLPDHAGGALGFVVGTAGIKWLGFAGSGLVLITLGVITVACVFGFSWANTAQSVGESIANLLDARREKREVAQDQAAGKRAAREREKTRVEERFEMDEHHPVPVVIEPMIAGTAKNERGPNKTRQKPLLANAPGAKLPSLDLLDAALPRQESVEPETLEMTSRLIEKKLKDFGVDVRVVAAAPGPVITRYEIEPAIGVKGSQVVNLAKDLARALSLVSIRVIETIPGKNFMALELPNAKRQSIRLSEILGSQVYDEAASLLTIALGKDIGGQAVVADLAKMPHCLVAGTTGSGKSVGINAMILSLLYKADARDVRLLLIDPKMLEMSVYEGIAHLLCPVVTDMNKAAHGLAWCVAEMERRYKRMSQLGVRNLAGYNAKIDEARARGESVGEAFNLAPEQPEPLERLPYIVVVIDELADLMVVAGKKVEELIARLAQKARAAGIHLVLATQRPSVDVITGLIKANIPTRLSFQVSSKIDSRTILDQMGAEALLGMGDMLYMPSGTGYPVRVHGAFVSDEEVHRVVAYLKAQSGPNYIDGVLDDDSTEGEGGSLEDDLRTPARKSDKKDPLYEQAVEIVLKNRKASSALLLRHLKIGYNRSARLLEDMEKAGLVGAVSSVGQRDVLVPERAQ
ncbi:MAG: DNA translocase FtsK [Polaromonas sp.]|nr:MAG: DNA translocase FtsK [Polaromonas sp.]